MYLLPIFLPLLSFLSLILFGRYIGKIGAGYIAVSLVSLSSFISFFIFYEVVLSHSVCTIKIIPWIESNNLYISWGFLFDSLTSIMLIVVTFISALVHLYSLNYMKEDPHLPRFLSYLSLFTFFMLMLISADNYVQMFLGWEGVGLASYLLINFWYTRIAANKAAMKALIVNRIGDFGLILALAFCFYIFSTFDFSIIFLNTPYIVTEKFIFFGFEIQKITLLALFLFLGAVGKSAQIGLHTWLPDAMEGPTPVSALIHAATMVTAGVFVILRSSPILEYTNTGLLLITIIGSLTAFMAATIGTTQNDLKRVIAYSTCSQLGYMILACGLSNYSVALFHLMNHAFFKALLFLSAGSVIHALSDEQDMRKMGGLLKVVPITYVMILIGSLALMGFPFLTGFYSKDIILELIFGNYHFSGLFAYLLGVISAACTAFYSLRLIFLTFIKPVNNSFVIINKVHESSLLLLLPLFILGIGSIFVGFLFKELFLGIGVDTWNNTLFQLPFHINTIESEFLPVSIKLIPIIFTLIGSFISYYIYIYNYKKIITLNLYKKYYFFQTFLSKKWYFDIIYNKFIVNYLLAFGYKISYKVIDRGLLELIGPLGLVRLVKKGSSKLIQLETGLIYNYAFSILLGLTCSVLLYSFAVSLKTVLLLLYIFIYIYMNIKKKINF